MTKTYGRLALSIILICDCTFSATFAADSYPNKPIRLIVPFPAGGSTDTVMRILGEKLTEALGQQVVIDNRPGAGTIIATDIGARSVPDGHTLLCVTATYTVNPSLYDKLPYDPSKSLAPVTLVSSGPNVLAVTPSVPGNTVKDLIAYAKNRAGQVSFGSAGVGSSTHLAGEMFKIMAHVNIIHVPYKGDPPAVTDLISGQIQMLFVGGWANIAQHVAAGKVKALAVTSTRPSALVPGLPTVASSGLPGFESVVWNGIVVPSGTPNNIIARLQSNVSSILKQADVRNKIMAVGFEPSGNSSAEFGEFLRSEIARWANVVKQAGIRIN